jgi:hypothetical protein
MSDVPTPRRHFGPWLIVPAAGVMLLAATVVGPAIEEVQREATRTRTENRLRWVVLEPASTRPIEGGPLWDRTGSADWDFPLATLGSIAYSDPQAGSLASSPAATPADPPAEHFARPRRLTPVAPVREDAAERLPQPFVPEPARVKAKTAEGKTPVPQPHPVPGFVPLPLGPVSAVCTVE